MSNQNTNLTPEQRMISVPDNNGGIIVSNGNKELLFTSYVSGKGLIELHFASVRVKITAWHSNSFTFELT
jgi:hypothetical protein